MEVRCPRCEHQWWYKGKSPRFICPRCRKYVTRYEVGERNKVTLAVLREQIEELQTKLYRLVKFLEDRFPSVIEQYSQFLINEDNKTQ